MSNFLGRCTLKICDEATRDHLRPHTAFSFVFITMVEFDF